MSHEPQDRDDNVQDDPTRGGSEANYRAIFNAANDAIFVHDLATGAILDVNHKVTEMYGCTVEEARNMTVEEMSAGVTPYTQQDALRWLQGAAAGTPQLFEWLSKDRSGRLFWTEVNLKRVTIGGEDRLVAIVRDITSRKQAQEALRQAKDELEMKVAERTAELRRANERLQQQAREASDAAAESERLSTRLRLLLESTDEGIYGTDQDDRCLFVNRSAARMLGYEPEELLGKITHGTFHHSRADGSPYPAEDCPLMGALQTGQGVRVADEVMWRRDGSCFPVELSAHPTVQDGVIHGAVVTFVDITERKRAQEAVASERTMLQKVIDQMPEGVFVAEAPDGRITIANDVARRLLGRDLPIGTPIDWEAERYGLFRPDGQPYAPDDLPISRALRGEHVSRQEVVVRRPDGSAVTVLVNCTPVGNLGSRMRAIAVFGDITPLKEAERYREEYIHMVSHDLRAPLTIIQGQAQLLRRALRRAGPDAGINEQSGRNAEAIVTSAKRMNAMLQDLVDVARIEAGRMKVDLQPVDLRAAIVELKERMAGGGGERIGVEAPADLPLVLADPDRLERVLANLVSNALKYSAADTPITISLSQGNGEVVAAVRDRGTGIPAEALPHLFERYYRTQAATRRREGLGLGLYITKGLVEAQGGRVWVESEEGKGSTFYFTLSPAMQTEVAD